MSEKDENKSDFRNEREILYKVLFDMKNDLNDLKKLTLDLMENDNYKDIHKKNEQIIQKMYDDNHLSSNDDNNRFLALSESVQKMIQLKF